MIVSPKHLTALAFILLLLLLGQSAIFAQQYPQIGPSYGAQYAPNPSMNDGPPPPVDVQSQPYEAQPQYGTQPQYGAQPQPYAQQSYADYGQPYPQQNQPQPLNAGQLEQLVAPVALYPDNLLAMILAASTYPMQVVQADRWRQAQGYASPDQIAGGADVQSWDPSVKALTAFPQVLAEMDQNLQWTTALGNAYFNQPQDVMEAVQVMRQRAQAAGNLQNNPQQTVGYYDGNIALYPANPQVVYVPAYNPWTVYGQAVSPYPGFSLLGALGSFFGSSPIQYGLGIAMSAFSHTPWGWMGWALNWLTQSVLFNHSNYYSHSSTVADWHLPPGSVRAFSGTRSSGSYMASANYGRGGYSARPASGFGSGFVREPQRYGYGYGVNHQPTNYGRPYPSPGTAYARPTQEAYNRTQPMLSRPQQYSRPAYSNYSYGSSFYNRPAQSYGYRPAPGYNYSTQAYRTPTSSFPRNEFTQRSSGTFASNGFAGYSNKTEHSGGFHLFGGSHSSENPYSGGHAPKSFNSKSFSAHSSGGFHFFGGHSGGGGHSSSHGSGGHHHG